MPNDIVVRRGWLKGLVCCIREPAAFDEAWVCSPGVPESEAEPVADASVDLRVGVTVTSTSVTCV